jgi:hypothetical protein
LRKNVCAQQEQCRHVGLIEIQTDGQMPTPVPPTSHNAISQIDAPPVLRIVVRPEKRGRFAAWVDGEQIPLCVSRQPFFDSARKLLERGCDPRTILLMRHGDGEDWALRATLQVAAKTTIDEHNGTVLAKWKPFSRSAGSARIASPAAELPRGRVDDRASQERTAE